MGQQKWKPVRSKYENRLRKWYGLMIILSVTIFAAIVFLIFLDSTDDTIPKKTIEKTITEPFKKL